MYNEEYTYKIIISLGSLQSSYPQFCHSKHWIHPSWLVDVKYSLLEYKYEMLSVSSSEDMSAQFSFPLILFLDGSSNNIRALLFVMLFGRVT